MTEKISVNTLKGVPETLLVPLYARAVETQRPDAICRDLQAVAMMAKIDYDFSKFDTNSGTAFSHHPCGKLSRRGDADRSDGFYTGTAHRPRWHGLQDQRRFPMGDTQRR